MPAIKLVVDHLYREILNDPYLKSNSLVSYIDRRILLPGGLLPEGEVREVPGLRDGAQHLLLSRHPQEQAHPHELEVLLVQPVQELPPGKIHHSITPQE